MTNAELRCGRGRRRGSGCAAFGAAALLLTFAPQAAAQMGPPPTPPPPASTPAPLLPPAPAAPSPYDPSMQAGGLTPPAPMPPAPPPGQPPGGVQENLDKSKEEDSGRGLSWVWLNVEGGFEHVGLQTFNVDEANFTAGFVDTSASGGVVGAGLGIRLLFLTLGARARVGFFSAWQLFSLGGELGFKIPIGNFEPHLELGAGYSGLGSVTGAVSGAADAISIRGLDARLGGGFDYYVTPVLSLGANISWELLVLTRPGVSPDEIARIKASANVDAARADALAAEGSGYGSALAITAMAGLHF